jgi:hypothetical protein
MSDDSPNWVVIISITYLQQRNGSITQYQELAEVIAAVKYGYLVTAFAGQACHHLKWAI